MKFHEVKSVVRSLRHIRTIIFVLTGLIFFQAIPGAFAQNVAISMGESLASVTRFNPYDTRQLEIIQQQKPEFFILNLKTDREKYAFWLNLYNSLMLINLRDTSNHGLYTTFYKGKKYNISGLNLSLFDIEHEIIRGGKKNRALGFRHSRFSKDTVMKKLRPDSWNYRVIFCMYRGLYGFPPYQVIENCDVETAFQNSISSYDAMEFKPLENKVVFYDWVKSYAPDKQIMEANNTGSTLKITYLKTPLAVYIKNYFPKYEGVKFKSPEENPWLKN